MNTLPTLLKGLCDAGKLEGAFVILGEMRLLGAPAPEEAIYNRLLNACFKEGEVNLAERIFKDMTRNGVRPSGSTFSLLIKTYGKCKCLDQAFDLVSQMQSYNVEPSVAILTCLMQACVRNRQTNRALDLFAAMKENSPNISPDVAMYAALINGCGYANFLSKGVDILEE